MKQWLTGFMILCSFLAGCEKNNYSPEQPSYTKTVLMYMVAENSLNNYTHEDVSEILSAKAKIPDGSELILYIDDCDKPRIYSITNQTNATLLSNLSAEYEYSDDPNSASADVFGQVLKYVMQKHKADCYGVIMWSHGSGWIDSTYPDDKDQNAKQRSFSFGLDNQKNTKTDYGHQMNISSMANALSNMPNIEFIMFDACFMQTIETAYALRNTTQYIIGSPAEIPGNGAPYHLMIEPMFAQNFNPDDLTRPYYEYYRDNTSINMGVLLSAINTKQLEPFATVTKNCLQGISLADSSYMNVQNYFLYDKWLNLADVPDLYDMQGVMLKNLPEERYAKWKEAYDKTVVSKYTTKNWYTAYGHYDLPVDSIQYGGVSMFIPQQKYLQHSPTFLSNYTKTDWYKTIKGND